MIDTDTGRIVFEDGLAIFPGMTTSDLPKMLASDEHSIGDDGRRSFRLGAHQLNGKQWRVAVFFSWRLDEAWLQQLSDSLPD